jgi:hypothetical protein
VERTYRESELIAILGEPKLRTRRRVGPDVGWTTAPLPTASASIWDCCGIFDAWARLRKILEEAISADPPSVLTDADNAAMEMFVAGCCLASETAEGSAEWTMQNVCKHHKASLSKA